LQHPRLRNTQPDDEVCRVTTEGVQLSTGAALLTEDRAFRSILPLLLILMFAEFTCAFETSMVVSGMGAWVRIAQELVTPGCLLVSASSATLCGRLGDLYGRREVLAIVLCLCALGSAISAFGPTLGWVIAGRALQGLSGAIIPLVYALARERFPARHLPTAIGAIVATAAAGAAVGLLAGGAISDHYGPQSVFRASLAMTAAGALLTAVGIPAIRRLPPPRQLDVLGGILLAPGVAALLLAISSLQQQGWRSFWVSGSAVVGIVLLSAWAHHESRHPDPLIDVRLLFQRENLLGNLIMVFLAAGSFQATLLMSLLIQQPVTTGIGLGVSATMVGIVKFPAMLCGLAASLWAGYAAGRHGPRLPIIVGCALTSVALIIGLFWRGTLIQIGFVVSIINCGVLAAYAGIPIVILAAMPSNRTGEATGMMSAARFIASGAGSQILVILLATRTVTLTDGVAYPSNAAFVIALVFMLVTALTATVLATMLRPAKMQRTLEPAKKESVNTLEHRD
jgi:MFS family permease